jgi:DNA polymerase elongation subunit (family B)
LYIDGLKTGKYFLVRELDKNRSSICKKIPYKTNLYLETNSESDYIGFKTNNNLKQFEFSNSYDYVDFKKKFEGRVYGAFDELLQYFSTLELDNNVISKINAWSIDIEVYSEKEFPYVYKANLYPITTISLHDFFTENTYTWIYDINNKCTLESNEKWELRLFNDEKLMLLDFMEFWKSNIKKIHVLTGWNVLKYDIPYIFNRINYLFENSILQLSDKIKDFSPFKFIKCKSDGKDYEYAITGIPILDYYLLFLKFSNKGYESYKLEEICQTELNCGKLDHSEYNSFADFYNSNINKYVEYNKADVELLKKLDDKFKFITLAVNIAYTCKIRFEQVFSPIRCWESLIYNKLISSKIVIPPNHFSQKQGFSGAFVKEPKKGMVKDIVSYDLTSLYPSVIRAINISPETLVENFNDSNASIEAFLNGYVPEKYHNKNYIIDPVGNIFTKEKVGVLPKLMTELFIKRITTKKLMQSKQKELQHLEKMLKEGIE